MNQAVKEMLKKYDIKTTTDAENALKEIMQEIALLGLHRSNFFEKAAFYGGTALRVLYDLPRFSEDLDFTLFKPEKNFQLKPYFSAIEKEFQAYGFSVNIEHVDKSIKSDIESAFVKANTKIHFLEIKSLSSFAEKFQTNAKLQIKFEVDTEPVENFMYETRYLLAPTSFPVISLQKPDLFAGKLHALLFRNWKNRIKGRDFYDYVWYLKNKTPVRISYLRDKALQSKHIKSASELQTIEQLQSMIKTRIQSIDIRQAKQDISLFIKDQNELSVWSLEFFNQITDQLKII